MKRDEVGSREIHIQCMHLSLQYDRRMKENQKKEDLSVRWDKSLSKKRIALFHFPNRDENELRLVTGDELKLKLVNTLTPVVVPLTSSSSSWSRTQLRRG